MMMEDTNIFLTKMLSTLIIAIPILETVLHITSASCPSPPQVIGSRHNATKNSYTTSTVIRYTCKSGFLLEEPSPLRVCLKNGSWTGQDSPCQINANSLGYAIVSCLVVIMVFVILIAWALNRHKQKQKIKRTTPFSFPRSSTGYREFTNESTPIPETNSVSSRHSKSSLLSDLPLSTWENTTNTPNDKGISTMSWAVSAENGTVESTPSTVAWTRCTENGKPASTVALSEVYPIDVTSL